MKKIMFGLFMAITASCLAQINPGWKNPTSFDEGNDSCYWRGRVGTFLYYYSQSTRSKVYDKIKTEGYTVNNSSLYTRDIAGHDNITSSTYDTPTDGNISNYNHFDAQHKRFRIITMSNSGIDNFTMAANGTGLQRIPEGYSSSIRLGDMAALGTYSFNFALLDTVAPNRTPYEQNLSGEALFYTMHVRPENSVIYINYALVARKFDMTNQTLRNSFCPGECIMRIELMNDDGTWPKDRPIDSSKAVRIAMPMYPSDEYDNDFDSIWKEGLVDNETYKFVYTPWQTVAADLSKWNDKTVRIEIYTCDANGAYPLYGYFAGDFAESGIRQLGCTPANSDAMDSLYAPHNLRGYKWYSSRTGKLDISNPSAISLDMLRPLQPDSTDEETNTSFYSYKYAPHYHDFILDDSTVADTQTFCCVIYHGFNKTRVDSTYLFINVANTKPAADFEFESPCGGPIALSNITPNRPNMDTEDTITTWYIYNDTLAPFGAAALDSLYGMTPSYHFDDEGWYKVTMCVVSEDGTCIGSRSRNVLAKFGASASITTPSHEYCAGDPVKLYGPDDPVIARRRWVAGNLTFESNLAESYDSLITTSLALGPNTVWLYVYAGNGCMDSTSIAISVYGTPDLSFIENDESAICPGDSALLQSVGTFAADNVWVSIPPDPLLEDQQGRDVVRVKPDTTTIYTLLAPENNNCNIQDKSITLEVIPVPVPKVKLSNTFVNTDHPVILAEDASVYGASTEWVLSDSTRGSDQWIRHTFTDLTADQVSIRMHSCNRLGCCSNDTTIFLPIQTAIHWLPNVFTPDRDNNNLFGITFSQSVYEYELYIYNRNGQLVFSSTDADEKWDGNKDGSPCPTGAYAFFLRYRFEYNDTRHITKGIVTLIR